MSTSTSFAPDALAAPRATTLTIFNKAAPDTPLKSALSSQQGSEQTHDEIDLRILQEINGCVYKDTKGSTRNIPRGGLGGRRWKRLFAL
jgi:hypothetical protein